jgi:hypothetical protein
MKRLKYIYLWSLAALLPLTLSSCFDLTEEVFDRVDNTAYYKDEEAVKSAVASIYSVAATSYAEYFYYMQEFSADQVAWRTWNGGLWGYDEGAKTVFSTHTWNADAVIIRSAWQYAWTTIGLCNTLIHDLGNLSAEAIGMTPEQLTAYTGEVRTLRAWAYYNIFEIWGGALPLNTQPADGSALPPTADPDFDTSCKLIYNFILTELDESYPAMLENAVNRMNQAANRMLKARLLLNAQIFIKEDHFSECADLCRQIIAGDFGTYALATDYRDIYSITNTECPEVVMAFACENGKLNLGWMRTTMWPYNIWDYFGGTYSQSPWNCVCIVPSYDNAGEVQTSGGSIGATCFLDAPYGDKLGAVYERFDSRDIRKQTYLVDSKNQWNGGLFLKGEIRANYGTGDALKADADRDGQPIVYVDQVGTFMNLGRNLETVMSPRWGETTSGYRIVKYPVYPESAGIDFQDIDQVEFRLSEVYYMLAECQLRAGNADQAKETVNQVRQRYFGAADWASVKEQPGRGFTAFDLDWMLSQWGIEFLEEGRRRRTDLRRFDKFTQGQWWFFGRTQDDGYAYPATRDRKYEWFPLPTTALSVNPGLIQNPNYQ